MSFPDDIGTVMPEGIGSDGSGFADSLTSWSVSIAATGLAPFGCVSSRRRAWVWSRRGPYCGLGWAFCSAYDCGFERARAAVAGLTADGAALSMRPLEVWVESGVTLGAGAGA
ncbi:hypothetical protein [Paraburkholderia sp. WC7.3d]|uniref:hypothetical protein n=1 Tax=Paraburkholderia sp. WC7.3d TaxID=2991069 RepID=UPI003D1C2F99